MYRNRFGKLLTVALVIALFPMCAHAHFLWLVRGKNSDATSVLHVYFGELPEADDPALLDRIAGAKLWQVSDSGELKELQLTKGSESLESNLSDNQEASMYILRHEYGVVERGGETFLLRYYAKMGPALGDQAWSKIDCRKQLDLDVVPQATNEGIVVTVAWEGKPVAQAQVVVASPSGAKDFEGLTDDKGQITFAAGKVGRYSIRARHIESRAGELDGKKFTSVRHYSTLALEVPDAAVNSVTADPQKPAPSSPYPVLPELVTSFGAAICDNALYVYGGHTGKAHSYYRSAQARTLRRLDLKDGKAWESLGEGPELQGLAMVAHGGKLYRLGGFTAMNEEGQEHDLRSTADVASFDTAKKEWQPMSPLPEPRSSFDAAVLGDKVYVIGGWQLKGDEESVWHKTAYALDLKSDNGAWELLPEPPFQRRALAVAAHDGKIFAVGGMQAEGGPSTRVDVFDPTTGKWSIGPSLEGEPMEGFGCSAFATGGKLYVSTIRGNLHRLSADAKSWEIVSQLPSARFFHRMLPLSEQALLVVGGASMETGKFEKVEVIPVGD